jgi:tetratricopeptide (TPR) repeat protein
MADAEALAERAKNLLNEGRLEEALLAARAAVADNDESANAWWQLTLVQGALGNVKEQCKALLQVIELAPHFTFGRSYYGNLLLKQGRSNEATEQFELALLEDPDHLASLRGMLAVLEPKKGVETIARCVQLLQKIRDQGEADETEMFSLAYYYGQQDDSFAAAHIYENLPALATKSTALQNLGVMYRNLQRSADAMDALRISHRVDDSNAKVTRLVNETAQERGALREELRKQADPYLEQADWHHHYVNPFTLLDLSPEQAKESVKALQKARQAVLRELELEDNSVSWVPGLHIDRSSALALFEELNDPARLEMHACVFRAPALEAFLSKGSLKHFTQDLPDDSDVQLQTLVSHELVASLSVKFAAQFDDVLTKAIERIDAPAVRALMSGRRWVLPEHDELCFEGATRSLLRMGEELDRLREKAKGAAVHISQVQHLLERWKLAKLLPWLPLEFHKVHEQVYRNVSQISIAHYGRTENAEEALVLLDLAKVSAVKSVALRHEYESGRETLLGFIAEENKAAVSLTFGSKTFTINKVGVTYDNKSIPAAQVHAFRWGMTQTRAQPPAWRLSISFGDGKGQELGVSWVAEGPTFDKQRAHWGELIDAAAAYLLDHALTNFKKKLSTGVQLPMGDAVVFEEGVRFTVKGFIFSHERAAPWANIATSLVNGDVVLRDRTHPKAIARVPIATTDNALLLRMLTPHKET